MKVKENSLKRESPFIKHVLEALPLYKVAHP
jgi:hypothetical protein